MKRVLVVGGSSGIGEAIAVEYSERKHAVVVAARREDRLEAVVQRCRHAGSPRASHVVVDVTDIQACRSMVEQAVAVMGGIDILFYSAGQAMHSRFENITDVERLNSAMFEVNFYGLVWSAHAAIPALSKSPCGQLVVVSSLAGCFGPPYCTLYAAAKHAVNGFVESLQLEEPPFLVTLACPGYTDTELDQKKVVSDGSVRAVPLQVDKKKYISAVECARKIVRGAEKGKKTVFLSKVASTAVTAKALAPSYINSKVRDEMSTMIPAEDSVGEAE